MNARLVSISAELKDTMALADAKATDLITLTNENEHLSVALKQRESDLNEIKELCRGYCVKIDKQEEQIKDMEAEEKKFHNALKEQNQKNKELTTQVDALNVQCTVYADRISSLNVEKDKARGKTELVESLLAKTEASLEDKIRMLEGKLSEQRQQTVESSSQLAVFKVNIQEANQRFVSRRTQKIA